MAVDRKQWYFNHSNKSNGLAKSKYTKNKNQTNWKCMHKNKEMTTPTSDLILKMIKTWLEVRHKTSQFLFHCDVFICFEVSDRCWSNNFRTMNSTHCFQCDRMSCALTPVLLVNLHKFSCMSFDNTWDIEQFSTSGPKSNCLSNPQKDTKPRCWFWWTPNSNTHQHYHGLGGHLVMPGGVKRRQVTRPCLPTHLCAADYRKSKKDTRKTAKRTKAQ